MNRKFTLIVALFSLVSVFNTKGQTSTSCAPNLDWETGTYANWTYYRGSVTTGPVFFLTATAAVPGLHTLTSGGGLDYYGGFPVVAPGGGAYSFQLGKDSGDLSTMRCQYNLHVPSAAGIYSAIYHYAVVLENPGHPANEQPRFIVQAIDSATGVTVTCDSYQYVADGSVPGFLNSSVTSRYSGAVDVQYKPWTTGNMKFPGENGRTVLIQFTASGCTQTGHFGYGYLDMTCGIYADQQISCASGTTYLTGPDGFSAYHWTDSATFTASLGTSQTVAITAPTVTTTYAVILTPFSGYGCIDTLYTQVSPSQLHMTPSHDTSICSGSTAPLSAGATSPYTPITYSWGPAASLSCTTCSSPIASPTSIGTTAYYCTATDGAGCIKTDTIHVTVIPNPSSITGPTTVCLGTTTSAALSSSPSGGAWTSGTTSVATIGSVSGFVTGVSVGTDVITYTLAGICKTTRGMTVNPLPGPATGTAAVCIGHTTLLSDTTLGGTWTTSSAGIASIGASTGIVTGVSGGTAVIDYIAPVTGCFATRIVTVNTSPGIPATTAAGVCSDSSISMLDFTPLGTWSCSPAAVGSISATTGIVTGLTAGSLVVTYTLPTGCYSTTTVPVYANPSPIAGPTSLCIGDSILLTDPTTGGSWSSSDPAVAFPPSVLSGEIQSYASGTTTIYYTNAGGCSSGYPITVNPFPSAILPATPAVCVGFTALLTDPDPGTWSISPTTSATINTTTGVVTGVTSGTTAIVTFTGTTGCTTSTTVNVNPLPSLITGPSNLCVGTTITLSDSLVPGTWTAVGGYASVNPSTGVVTGVSMGSQLITYTYNGCSRTYPVTVNTTPPAIYTYYGGPMQVCQGGTLVINDAIGPGTWSISPSTVATIAGVPTATVTGVVVAGSTTISTATVTYSLGGGCSTTAVVTVNPLPAAIAAPAVCAGSSAAVPAPAPTGGSWTTSGAYATISPTGVISGIATGTQQITYIDPAGCSRTGVATVNVTPLGITGPSPLVACVGGTTITLHDGTGGGAWSSLNPTIATIAPTTGIVSSVAVGTATIKYSLPTGCATTIVVSVDPEPTAYAIGGGGSYCAGGSGVPITISGSQLGMVYKVYVNDTATTDSLSGTGAAINFGLQTRAGSYTVIARNTITGCTNTMTGTRTVSINPVPVFASGPTALCVGNSLTLTPSILGGSFTSSCPTCVSVTPVTGVVTGHITGDSSLITYTLGTGCTTSIEIHVSPSPSPIWGPSSVCIADSVQLFDSVSGGAWTVVPSTIANVNVSTGFVTGVTIGTATVTYSLGTGCQQYYNVTVKALPGPITPATAAICENASVNLFDVTTPGGAWSVAPASSSLVSITGGGTVTAAYTGASTPAVATIYYTSPTTGCHNWSYVTVNPLPVPISGAPVVCVGSSTTLSDATPGGSWSVSGPDATISVLTGNLSGIAAGTSSIVTYTAPNSCIRTAVVTVSTTPSISYASGTGHVCQGGAITMAGAPAGGTWTTSIGSIAPSGVLTGGAATGSGFVTYSLGSGCFSTKTVTVNVTPSSIIGPSGVCQGLPSSVVDPTPGGTWSSSNPVLASIGASTGLVTTSSSSAGRVIFTYSLSYGTGSCPVFDTFNVLAPPATIGGAGPVCVGSNRNLTDDSLGGVWSTGNPAVATVSATGTVTGIASGTVIISYGASTCNAVTPIVVNPISSIVGDSVICVGQTSVMTDTTLGGTWSCSPTTIATITASSGYLTGVAAGTTAVVSYLVTATGCTATKPVTINPVPSPIGGTSNICIGQTRTFVEPTPGGSWSSSNTATATVDAGGNVTGIAAGAVTISYSLSTTGCAATYVVTVNPLPSPIAGPSNVCLHSSMLLSDSTSGTWSSSASTIASVSSTGIVTGDSLGTATISITSPVTLCSISKLVSVVNGPSAIYGSDTFCQGSFTTLYDTSGVGTWSSSAPTIAVPVGTTGSIAGVNPGMATITYSTGAGCNATTVVVVNITPTISDADHGNVCLGESDLFTGFPAGGVWSSSDSAIASVTGSGTSATVFAAGPGSANITYLLSDGCSSTIPETVNVGPAPITGFPQICVGLTSALADGTFGGAWSSSTTAVATIDPTGVVTGVSHGTSVITYAIPTSVCPSLLTVSVNPAPGAIGGTESVCVGQNTTLTNPVPSGLWTSADTTIANVGISSGSVSGVSAGTVTITYTLGFGCFATAVATVNPIPSAVIGIDSVCQGQFLSMFDATLAGAWSSSRTSVATIGAATGILTGIGAGVTTVSYTVAGCAATMPVSVDTQPAAITGNTFVCLGGTSPLADVVPGGVWGISTPAIASISTSGVVFGVSLGSAVVSYVEHPGACLSTALINVVPLPSVYALSGGGNYCAGGTGVPIGLSSSAVGVNYLLYNGVTAMGTFAGTGSALSFGLETVRGTYTVIATSSLTGCSVTMSGTAVVGVTPSVTPEVSLNVTPGDTVCTGTTVTLSPVTVNSGSAPVYAWSVNGTSVSSGGSYSFIPADGDSVNIAMTSNANCASPATVNGYRKLKVDPYAYPSVSVGADPGDTVCQGTLLLLNAVPVYPGASPSYTWMVNGLVVGYGFNYSYVPRSFDAIQVIMNSNYHCRLSSLDTSASLVVKLDSPAVPLVSISANPGTLISEGQSLTLTASVINGGSAPTYQWYVNGILIAGATNSSYTSSAYHQTPEDSVACQVTANGTCPATGMNWVFIQVANVGVAQVAGSGADITVVPNPNKGDFFVKGSLATSADVPVTLELTDVLGQVMFKNTFNAAGGKIDEHITTGSTLANGMYVLTVRSEAGTRIVHLVVEQ